MSSENQVDESDPTPLWIPLAAIFVFVPIMLAVTIVVGYLLLN